MCSNANFAFNNRAVLRSATTDAPSAEQKQPQPPAKKRPDGYKARRASVNECGEIVLITQEGTALTNVFKRPQISRGVFGKTSLQKEIDAQIAKCKLTCLTAR